MKQDCAHGTNRCIKTRKDLWSILTNTDLSDKSNFQSGINISTLQSELVMKP